MLRRIIKLTFALGLCCSGAFAQTDSYSLLSITSPRPGEDLSAAGSAGASPSQEGTGASPSQRGIRIAWESLLGEGIDYWVVSSQDGKTFDREIASKLTDYEYAWQPEDPTLVCWLKVKAFRDGYLMAESVVPVSFLPAEAIVVSKADQKVFHFSNGELKDTFTCSTALPGYDLKAGRYSVYLRQRKHWSKKWEVWMPHSLFFHAGYALHATTQIRRLGRPASHGCIRLRPKDAEKLYGEVEVGTPVIVMPKSKGCSNLVSFFAPKESPQKPSLAAKSN